MEGGVVSGGWTGDKLTSVHTLVLYTFSKLSLLSG